MFQSATVKLTGWYLLILMGISLLFSTIIFQVATLEVNTRLESLQLGIQQESDVLMTPLTIRTLRNDQAHVAEINLFFSLLYANILILIAGGVGSYLLARRTLKPLEESHEAQSRFTSDASHELRTPLAVMKAELEVALRDTKLSKHDMHELLQSNLEEVDKLTNLTHLLLQLARLDYTALKTERVALTALVRQTVSRFGKEGSRIAVTAPSNEITIDAHEPSIEELLGLLIDNALKYSPHGSTVTITLKKKAGKAHLEISNLGAGIHKEILPYIFDRFFRGDTSRTDGAKNGYGLGLSLAKKIVEIHNGDLSATSAPNAKTTFSVALPLHNSSLGRLSEKFSKESS